MRDAGGNITAYQYDETGNLIQTTNPDGYSISAQYDAGDHKLHIYDQEKALCRSVWNWTSANMTGLA